MNDTTREVGGAIGIAVVGALISVGYRSAIEPAVAKDLVQAGQSAFTNGLQPGMFTAAVIVAFGAVLVATPPLH